MSYENQLYYFAGFFDGEGCVQVSKNGSIQLRITNTNLEILNYIKNVFGGSVGKRSQIVNKPQYTWSAYGDLAVELSQKLFPICKEKGKQLQVALEWMEVRKEYTAGIRFPNKKGRFKNPEREIKIKEYQNKISRLMKGIDE